MKHILFILCIFFIGCSPYKNLKPENKPRIIQLGKHQAYLEQRIKLYWSPKAKRWYYCDKNDKPRFIQRRKN